MTQQLSANGQEDAVAVCWHDEEFAEETDFGGAHGGFLFAFELAVDVDDFGLYEFVILSESAQSAQILNSFCLLLGLDEPTRTLDCEEAEGEDDGGEVEVECVGNDPLNRVVVADVQ